jgi:long-chain alkane monooxygenase
MEQYIDEGGCTGFTLLATDAPGCFNDGLVVAAQRRGRYRTRDPGTTLGESLKED